MAIHSTPPGQDYKVFFSVEPNQDKRNDAPSPMLKFQCNVRIKYVSEGSDASLPTDVMDHDSWRFFHLPYDLLTCGDNFSSFQPRRYIAQMLDLMKIPFELDRLFWKQSHQDKECVPLENPDDIETLIWDAACAMVDAVGVSEGKGLSLLVTVEKEVAVPHEYVAMSKAKQDALFCKVRDEVAWMLQLEEQGQKFPKSEWDDMFDDLVKSGLMEGLQKSYLASLMKRVERSLLGTEQA